MGVKDVSASWILRRIGRIFLDFIAQIIGYFHPAQKWPQIPPITDPILMTPASDLVEMIKNRKVTCERVMKAYIERCKEVQGKINAIIDERFEDALKDAIEYDKRIASGTLDFDQLPLVGIPFTAKDSISIKGMLHTSGFVQRRGVRADRDAAVVANMRAAGGIPIAITNTPELCMWWDSFNRLYGRTVNPYDLSRIAGGSSGGEAALCATGATTISIGSDLAGSIRIPALFNGLYGHKTTPHVVPLEGMYPYVEPERQHMLSYGPISRYAKDLLPSLKVMAGPEGAAKLKLDQPVDLKKLKVFYMLDDGGDPFSTPVDPEIKQAILKAVHYLQATYNMEVTKATNLTQMSDTLDILMADLKRVPGKSFTQFLAGDSKEPINLWLEFVKLLFGQSKHTLHGLFVCIMELMTPDRNDPTSIKYHEIADELKMEFERMLGDNGVFIYPTHPEPAPKHQTTVLKVHNGGYTSIFNTLHMASTECPAGLTREGSLPIGFQIVAASNQDRLSIAVAEALDECFGGWVPPCHVKISKS